MKNLYSINKVNPKYTKPKMNMQRIFLPVISQLKGSSKISAPIFKPRKIQVSKIIPFQYL